MRTFTRRRSPSRRFAEGVAIVAVAERPDVQRAGRQLVIHDDVAARVDRDSPWSISYRP
jgi:hypothetical protein